jgi:AcrR family transcriptional regulator
MGRKDLTETRREQILDAFERCIIEFGLIGTTLTKVAERAQINRGQIHQYIGDRNALFAALVERLIVSYKAEFSNYLDANMDKPCQDTIVEYLFEEWGRVDADDDLIIDAIMAESAHNLQLHRTILDAYTILEAVLADMLHNSFPSTPIEGCQDVAYALMSMAYGNSTMLWLGFERSRLIGVRSLARTLIKTLE